MESFLFTLVSFLAALAVLITVHEYGHFWVARRLGVRVLRFSIGFGHAVWKRVSRWDGTEYAIGALPLGGYVKMLDEREGPVAEVDLPRAFNRQPLWRRSAIVLAGPVSNLMFAVLAYWLVLVSGDTGLRPLIGSVVPESVAEHAGFRVGDELLTVGAQATPTWESAVLALMGAHLRDQDVAVRVRTGSGEERELLLRGAALGRLADDADILDMLGLAPERPAVPPLVGEVVPGDPAQQAGMRPGDLLLSADGTPMTSWAAWVDYVRARPGRPIQVQVRRDGSRVGLTLTPRPLRNGDQTIGHIGATVDVPPDLYDRYRVVVRQGPVQALGSALDKTVDLSLMMLKVLGRMLSGHASIDNLSGPISIAESAGRSASYGLTQFIKFLAVVSISLGILNLLPIPVLDGGHLFFFLIEAVKGSPLSERAQLQGQRIGAALLLMLMTLAFYVDLSRLLG
jgi:regulator of sigma E protease